MKNPIISVIVPVYNLEKYLDCCLASLASQSFKNFEVIIVDASNDSSQEIAKKYINNYHNFHYYFQPKDGLGSARNYGISKSKGEYLAFVDGDDYVDNNFLSHLYSSLIRNDADICICGYTEFTDKKIIGFDLPSDGDCCLFDGRTIWEHFYKTKNISIITAWSKLYKRDLFNNIKFERVRFFEDELLDHVIFDVATKIVCLNEPLYFYRKNREDSLTSQIKMNELQRFSYVLDRAVFFIMHDYPLDITKPLAIHSLVLFSNNCLNYSSQNVVKHFRTIKSFLIRFKNNLTLKQKIRLYYPHFVSLIVNLIRFFKKIINNCRERSFIKKYSNKKWIVGTPTHDNLGDQAIAETTVKFLGKDYKEINFDKFNSCFELLLKCNPTTIVMLGGGNLGNVFAREEELRCKVIGSFPNSKIVIFPQTIWFEEGKNLKFSRELLPLIYDSHQNLTLFAREKFSYYTMLSLFKHTTIKLCPDTVFLNRPVLNNHKSNKKVLVIIREDHETNGAEKANIDSLLKLLANKGYCLVKTDTAFGKTMNPSNRRRHLLRFFKKIRSADFVVTDRLHGMVFSFINSTPFIAFTNYNHKIDGTFEWIHDNPFSSIGMHKDKLDSFVNQINCSPKEFTFNFKLFEDLISEIK